MWWTLQISEQDSTGAIEKSQLCRCQRGFDRDEPDIDLDHWQTWRIKGHSRYGTGCGVLQERNTRMDPEELQLAIASEAKDLRPTLTYFLLPCPFVLRFSTFIISLIFCIFFRAADILELPGLFIMHSKPLLTPTVRTFIVDYSHLMTWQIVFK